MTDTAYDLARKIPFKVQHQICKLAERYEGLSIADKNRALKKIRSIAKKYDLDLEWLASEYEG